VPRAVVTPPLLLRNVVRRWATPAADALTGKIMAAAAAATKILDEIELITG